MTSKLTITDERLAELVAFKPLPGTDITSATRDEWMAMAAELQERRKAERDSEPFAYIIQDKYERERGVEGHLSRSHVSKYVSQEDINEHEITCTPLYHHAQPAPVVVPEGLNPETTDLVLRFASALADKLYKAEQKYGRSTDWMKDDWYDDCLQSLWEHIEKGDPRDVAAYCAFMWYHGWVTTDYDRNVQNACRAAMLNGGKS
ncbi:hypothetical protein N2K17_01415 [Klebsiella michiganensis]|uniref:hypothetical protein n=1 Tax=Klebsiella michiganensis TaxID=1134687 RepID=UPI00224ECFF6|nr:hypothetical protein [Klebsiella michiganensis]MCX3078400.1 hypothetical protein [Klebsiella michiganensis]MCY0817691.1 hypothetical protein [Klebsiella michiganensis]